MKTKNKGNIKCKYFVKYRVEIDPGKYLLVELEVCNYEED